MEAADDHRQLRRTELAGDVDGTGELVGLDPDEADETAACLLDPLDDAGHVDDGVAFVIGLDVDVDIRPQGPGMGANLENAVNAGEAVGGDGRAHPLDDIAPLVIVRGLDEDDFEGALGHVLSPGGATSEAGQNIPARQRPPRISENSK